MASSGWQGEQFATNSCFSQYILFKVDLNVQSITHTGTDLTIVGQAAWCVRQRQSSGGSTTFGYPCYLTPEGGKQYTVVAANVRQNVGSNYYAPSSTTYFTVVIHNVAASATSYNYSCAWSAPGNNTGAQGGTSSGTVYWTLNFDPYVPPVTFTPKLYGSVNGRARRVKKLYCSVNNQTRKIKKLYAGDANGNAKLIYEDS